MLDNVPPTLHYRNPDKSWDSKHTYLVWQRESLMVFANLALISLHRPHIIAHAESRRCILQAAINVLESMQRTFSYTAKERYGIFGLAFYTVYASIILYFITAMDMPRRESSKQRVEHAMQQGIKRLSSMENSSQTAKAGLQILRRCYRRIGDTGEATKPTERIRDFSKQFPSYSYSPCLLRACIHPVADELASDVVSAP